MSRNYLITHSQRRQRPCRGSPGIKGNSSSSAWHQLDERVAFNVSINLIACSISTGMAQLSA